MRILELVVGKVLPLHTNSRFYVLPVVEASNHVQNLFLSVLRVGLGQFNNNNNNFRVSNIRVSNRTLIYNVCPEAALT